MFLCTSRLCLWAKKAYCQVFGSEGDIEGWWRLLLIVPSIELDCTLLVLILWNGAVLQYTDISWSLSYSTFYTKPGSPSWNVSLKTHTPSLWNFPLVINLRQLKWLIFRRVANLTIYVRARGSTIRPRYLSSSHSNSSSTSRKWTRMDIVWIFVMILSG